jgi:hypothetical protein
LEGTSRQYLLRILAVKLYFRAKNPTMRKKVDMFGTEPSSGTDPEPQRGQGPAEQIEAGDRERERETPALP